MDEFWVCQHCRSLNRAGTGRCYHCREKFGSRPKEEPGTIIRGAAAVAPLPLPANPTFTGDPNAPYLSRPVALAPTVNPLGAAPKKAGPWHRPHPIGALQRRITWSMAMRPSVPIAGLGYLCAALLGLLLVTGVLLIVNSAPAFASALQTGSLTELSARLGDELGPLRMLGEAFVVLGVLTLIFYSFFTGLATHNAPGLGSDTPFLAPSRAGLVWVRLIWAQIQMAAGLIVPAVLIWKGYIIPGLIVGVVAVEVAQRHLDDPMGWLSNPNRHVVDLYNKLGVQGASSSWMATLWSACFRAANVMAVALYAMPLLAVIVIIGSALVSPPEIASWQTSGLGPIQIGLLVLVGGLLVWTVGTLALLIPVTIEIVNRQRTRRTLVRVGRSRSWVARPGGADAPPAMPTARYDAFDRTLDRTVERYPAPIPGRTPDQASLYSPSTTSSPWSPDSPDGPSA